MILPDVNLLIHAHNANSPVHVEARDWWEGVMNRSHPVGLTWVVARGFIKPGPMAKARRDSPLSDSRSPESRSVPAGIALADLSQGRKGDSLASVSRWGAHDRRDSGLDSWALSLSLPGTGSRCMPGWPSRTGYPGRLATRSSERLETSWAPDDWRWVD